MSSESDLNQPPQAAVPEEKAADVAGGVVLKTAQVQAMRQLLHELANILTGITIAGGLLSQHLEQTPLGESASGLYGDCERGRRLVWQLRGHLLDADQKLQAADGEQSGGATEKTGAVRGGEKQGQPSSAAADGGRDEDDRRQR